MSLASTTILIDSASLQATVYGMGKSREGIQYLLLQTAFLELHCGRNWRDAPIAFASTRRPASFGAPFKNVVDGVGYVRVYNAPPRTKTRSVLENNLAQAKDAEHRALEHLQGVRIATQARLDDAHFAHTKAVAETIKAQRALEATYPSVTVDLGCECAACAESRCR